MNKSYLFLALLCMTLGTVSLAGATVHQVNIQGFAYNPVADTVAPGDSIQWTNLDIFQHSATDSIGPQFFDSGLLNQNQSYTFQFTIAGHYIYKCTIHHFYGTVDVIPVGVEEGKTGAPVSGLALLQNNPNPFSNKTQIALQLSKPGPVTLEVYDLLGKKVASLTQGTLAAGAHEADWDGRNTQGEKVAPGVYFYRLTAEGKSLTHSLILVR